MTFEEWYSKHYFGFDLAWAKLAYEAAYNAGYESGWEEGHDDNADECYRELLKNAGNS